MNIKIYKLLAIVLALSLVLTGCIGINKKSGIGAEQGYVPKGGGTLNLSAYSPDTLNPLSTHYSCIRDFLYLAYEGLYTVNEDLTVTPVLASGCKISDKNTVFRIDLKKGVKFHDGTAFTSKDVVATFDYIKTYETFCSHALENVEYYEADGDYTVEIGLKSPMVNFLCNLDFPILSSGLKAKAFEVPNYEYKINGTGRYMYHKTNQYSSLILKKNDSWHKDEAVHIPKVCIRYVNDNDAILYAFDSGETDIVTTERGRWGEFSYTAPHKPYEITTTRYMFVGINTRSSAFSDLELRKSLASLIDKEAIADSVMFSHACIADTPLPSKGYFYRNDEDKAPGYTSDYIKSKKNLSTYILYNEESIVKENIAKYIKSRLEEAGVRAELTKVDYDTYRSKVESGDYQLYIGEINLSRDCDLSFMFKSTPKVEIPQGDEVAVKVEDTPDTSYNISGICDYSNPKLNDIINNFNSAKDEEGAKMAYNNLRVFYEENLPQIPLFHINDALLINERIKGKVKVNLTNFYSDTGGLYIE